MTILCPFCALKGEFNVVMCVRAKRLLCCLEKSVKKENRWQRIEGQRLYSFELLTFLYLKTHVLCLLIQNSTEKVMEFNSHRIKFFYTKLFLQNFISMFCIKIKQWLKIHGTTFSSFIEFHGFNNGHRFSWTTFFPSKKIISKENKTWKRRFKQLFATISKQK